MKRFRFALLFVALLALVLAPIGLTGCSCGGQPTLTLRNPFQIDAEPATIAGPRMMQAPAYYTPSWTPSAGACAPGYGGPGMLPPGYSYAPAPAYGAGPPCDPPGTNGK